MPTLAELGFKGVEADLWYGMLAPAGTPAEIVARINADMRKALALPEVKTALSPRAWRSCRVRPRRWAR